MAASLSPFPPSFDGNPLSYGFALFSLTLVSAVSLTIIAGYLLDWRARRAMDSSLRNHVTQPSFSTLSPISLHRLIVSGFLLTIFLGAFPDVLVMLAWGETGARAMDQLFLVDRICDALVLVPFVSSVLLTIAAGQTLDHKLALDSMDVRLFLSWPRMAERLKMVAVVMLIAVGVTFAKVGA